MVTARVLTIKGFCGNGGGAWAPLCLPEQMPVALLCLSLSILDGSMLPSIKIDWISMKKSNPFLSLSKALPEVSSKCHLPYT